MRNQTIDCYNSILDALISFIDGLGKGEEYGKEKVSSQEKLNWFTPYDVI